jgi:hypothetical protein
MALVILHPQLGKIVVPGVLKALAIRPARPPRSVTVPWLRIQGRDPGRPPVLDDEPERDFALDNAGRLVEIAPRGPWPRMRGLVIGWVPALLIEEQWIPVLVIGLSQKVAKCSPASEKAVTRQRYAAAFPQTSFTAPQTIGDEVLLWAQTHEVVVQPTPPPVGPRCLLCGGTTFALLTSTECSVPGCLNARRS